MSTPAAVAGDAGEAMTLKYVKIWAEIFQIADLSLPQKVMLGMISQLPKGLLLSNEAIGLLLGLTPTHVSRLLVDMEQKGHVQFCNRQSRHRAIHLGTSAEVKDILLLHQGRSKDRLTSAQTQATSASTHSTSAPVLNISKGSKGTEKTEVVFVSASETHDATPEEIESLEAEGLI